LADAMSFAASISPAIPRAALVTGGAQPIGRAIALVLAEEPATSIRNKCHGGGKRLRHLGKGAPL
jgi:hypothetical protein